VIWILLAALGIPVWMLVGALAATLLSRRAFKRQPGVFRVKLRSVSGDAAGLKDRWPRRPSYARWVHDVLLVQRGLALIRTEALPTVDAQGSIASRSADEIHGLGDNPLVLTLVVDGGASVELAAEAGARATMVGPHARVASIDVAATPPPG
jgi:hypothetical protein